MDSQQQFKHDMEKAGFKIRKYAGRYYYYGYGAEVKSKDFIRAIRSTNIDLHWDNLGYDFIIYPKESMTREEFEKL